MLGGSFKHLAHVCKVHSKSSRSFERDVSPQKVRFFEAQNEVRIFWENVIFLGEVYFSKAFGKLLESLADIFKVSGWCKKPSFCF